MDKLLTNVDPVSLIMREPESAVELLKEQLLTTMDEVDAYVVARKLSELMDNVARSIASTMAPEGESSFGFKVVSQVRRKYNFAEDQTWQRIKDEERALARFRKAREALLKEGGIDPTTGEVIDPVSFEEQVIYKLTEGK